MRGQRDPQPTMPAFVDPGEVVPPDHSPLRLIKALARLSPEFDVMYTKTGCPSAPPGDCGRPPS